MTNIDEKTMSDAARAGVILLNLRAKMDIAIGFGGTIDDTVSVTLSKNEIAMISVLIDDAL